jgi:hypothetical protein
MLIQKVARSDSIVAARMRPADFCNNIRQQQTSAAYSITSSASASNLSGTVGRALWRPLN